MGACAREAEDFSIREGESIDLALHFGTTKTSNVTVSTKGTLDLAYESRVSNLYVFIFDANGKKFYGRFFDENNYGAAEGRVDWWERENLKNDTPDIETVGTVHIKTITKAACTIVGLANIDVSSANLSPERLSMISSIHALNNLEVTLKDPVVIRNGLFLMSGTLATSIEKDDSKADDAQEIAGELLLRRLDAKVQFNVQVKPGSKIAEFTPVTWQVVNVPSRTFLMEHGQYGDDVADLEDASTEDTDFFSTRAIPFETEVLTNDYYTGSSELDVRRIGKHQFSFYMYENRKAPVATPKDASDNDRAWTYADREKQVKSAPQDLGTHSSVTNGAFAYTHPHATYVIIKGRVRMAITEGESVGSTLSADVQYIIHLGDFSAATGSLDDFNIFRNHSYTYNIYINGVTDIEAEVENNYEDDPSTRLNEPEPGATGLVVIAREEVYPCDAHYNSHVISFHAKNIDSGDITWYVQTPFNPDGAQPDIEDGVEHNTHLIDYQWVLFRVNDMDKDTKIYFDKKRQIFKPQGYVYPNGEKDEYPDGTPKTMNISQLVRFLKSEKVKYLEDLAHAGEPGYEKTSIFDENPMSEGGPKITVTAFVNEYYYEEHPITHAKRNDLWKDFVNKPIRQMHVLSHSQVSADGESKMIGASFTIQQKSIQTIYNINNPGLKSAWGSEHEDDPLESGSSRYSKNDGKDVQEFRGNSSHTNGRFNTMIEWGLVDADGNVPADHPDYYNRWDTYMELTADNTTPLMKTAASAALEGHDPDGYQFLRYSCMSRNRDNNGNGIIDPEEIRWYMGAEIQLIGLFMGDYGIEGTARLYQRTAEQQASYVNNVWRQHVIASNAYFNSDRSPAYNSNEPRVIWAEEAVTGSDITRSKKHSNLLEFSTRCVRNLGYDTGSGKEFSDPTTPITAEPDPYVVITRMKNGEEYPDNGSNPFTTDVYYHFDCTNLNVQSLREQAIPFDLPLHNEKSEWACLYREFESASVSACPAVPAQYNKIKAMNDYLTEHTGNSNQFCPDGYRLPNLRELALLRNFIPEGDIKSYFSSGVQAYSRTTWSFGITSPNYAEARTNTKNSYGWSASSEKVLMGLTTHTTSSVRCVRDISE